MQHTWSLDSATRALAPASATARLIAVLIGVALCVVAMGIAPRAGADPRTRLGLSTRSSTRRPSRCRRVSLVI